MTRPDGKIRMDMLDWKAEAFLHPAPMTPDGPPSSPSVPTSRRQLWLDLIASHANGNSRELSETLHLVETGELVVNLQNVSLNQLREAFQPNPKLNPDFVDWVMGLLPGWTNIARPDFDAEEMASYRSRLLARLSSCLGD